MAAVLAATGAAPGELINIDLNTRWGGPTAGFGAASGQAGHWNSFDGFTVAGPPRVLSDLGGNATDVTAAFPLTFGVGSGNVIAPVIPAEASALLDDYGLVTDIPERLRLEGLDAGEYDVYVYGTSLPIRTTFIVRNGIGLQVAAVAGGWNGGFEDGVNFRRFRVEVVSGRLDVDWVSGSAGFGVGAMSGVQVVAVPGPGGAVVLGVFGVVAIRPGMRSRRGRRYAGLHAEVHRFRVPARDVPHV